MLAITQKMWVNLIHQIEVLVKQIMGLIHITFVYEGLMGVGCGDKKPCVDQR